MLINLINSFKVEEIQFAFQQKNTIVDMLTKMFLTDHFTLLTKKNLMSVEFKLVSAETLLSGFKTRLSDRI